MDTVTYAVVVTALAGIVGTGLGGLLAAFIGRDSDKNVSLLLSFAAGIMLAVVSFDLLPDAIHPEGSAESIGIYTVIGGTAVGYVVIALLNRIIDRRADREVPHIDKDHPKTADSLGELIHSDHYEVHKNRKSELFTAGVVMAFAIALHNMPEGMVIGASFAYSDISSTAATGALLLAIVIGFHNIPEGMAVAVPLIAGGTKKFKAVLLTALSGAPTVIGALIGYWIGAMSPLALSFSMSFASGAMLYVIFGELLPESILIWRSKLPAFMVLCGIAVGMLVVYA
ncbi:MAG: ZIP family metal transporter [Clostridiales bacterium]|nr:ZIP family metal transporter [Clostridiales bacterium]